jgi:hypothetical protein
MTGSPPELRSFLEAEMFYGVKKRERIAYLVAGGGLAIGLMGMIAVVTLLPLKQTEAFLAIEPLSARDGADILAGLKREAQRGLSPNQEAFILERFEAAGASPLYLRIAFAIAPPPFAEDPLRAVSAPDAMAEAAPAEGDRRLMGQERDSLYGFGLSEQP